MSKKDIVNVVLVFMTGILAILAALGGVNAESWAGALLMNAGAALLGGALVNVLLFGGLGFDRTSPTPKSSFRLFKRNQDLGTEFWVEFIAGIGTDPVPLVFVGRRHLLWIDQGHDYRRAIAEGVKERLRRFRRGDGRDGRVTVIVSDPAAFEAWQLFLSGEILPEVDAAATQLIRLGRADDAKIRYSAVAHGGGVLVTTALSAGTVADSPTFLVDANSDIGLLYRKDMQGVVESVGDDRWWTPELHGQRVR